MRGGRWTPAREWSAVDVALGLPDDATIRRLAIAIDQARKHAGDRKAAAERIKVREIGLAGERAACRVLGVPMDTEVRKTGRGKRRTNIVLPSGVPVDVVTRTLRDGDRWPDLILRVAEVPRDDLALVLVIWTGWDYEPIIPGWQWEREVRAYNRVESFRSTPNYVYPPSLLREMHRLRMTGPADEPSAQAALF